MIYKKACLSFLLQYTWKALVNKCHYSPGPGKLRNIFLLSSTLLQKSCPNLHPSGYAFCFPYCRLNTVLAFCPSSATYCQNPLIYISRDSCISIQFVKCLMLHYGKEQYLNCRHFKISHQVVQILILFQRNYEDWWNKSQASAAV